MTTTSTPLNIGFQPSGNVTTLSLSTPPLITSLELEGIAIDPFSEPDLEELPPTNPVFEPGETNQPPNPYEPSTDLFNHLLLPRITNAPSNVFNISVKDTNILINNIDYSAALYSLDWAVPLSGVSQGNVTLKSAVGTEIDPDFNGITQGAKVEISHTLTGQTSRLLTRCFVIGNPTFTLGDDGTYTSSITLGDELSLSSNVTRQRSKYCGPLPRTTQQLASIYAQTNGLRTRVFPVGHNIEEPVVNNFLTESAYDLLRDLYAPINRDVRCSNTGAIIFPKRPDFNPNQAKHLSYRDVIETENNFSNLFEPYSTVKVYNDFTRELPFSFQSTSQTTVQGLESNTKPWFQGGYTETITETRFFGDTEVWVRSTTRGYVPTNPRPWDAALVNEDPCAEGSFSTTFQVINVKTKQITYENHPSGAFLINGERNWEEGKQIFQLESGDYNLFDGRISFTNETIGHVTEPNKAVCKREYNVVVTRRRKEIYNINSDRDYGFTGWIEERYTSSGESSTLGQSAFTGIGKIWNKTTDQGDFSEQEGTWIIQPTITERNVNPLTASFIRPVTQDVTNFSEVSLMPGNLEPRPLSASFCYNKTQLDTVGLNYLKEEYGLSKSKVLAVPLSKPINLGDSIYYTDRNGLQNPYIVWTVEVNQTLNEVTKALVLLRVYE